MTSDQTSMSSVLHPSDGACGLRRSLPSVEPRHVTRPRFARIRFRDRDRKRVRAIACTEAIRFRGSFSVLTWETYTMFRRDPKPDSTPLINFCVRITPAMKAALQRRAMERSKRDGVQINAGQIVREMVAAALGTDSNSAPLTIEEQLFDELLVAAFFARRSLAALLQQHKGLAQDLLARSRTELEQRKRGRR